MRATLRICVGLVLALSGASCATTAADVYNWGKRGDYERVSMELKTGKASDDVRIAIAEVLGKVGREAAVADLITLAHDPRSPVRIAAVRALGQYNGAKVYPAVLQATGDDDAEVARSASAVVMTWGDDSLDFALEAMDDPNYRVRASAVQLMARLKGDRAGKAVCKRAEVDDSAMVRRESAKALGLMAYGGCRQTLYKMKSSDGSAEVMQEAELALAKIGQNISATKLIVIPPATVPDGISASFRGDVANEVTRQIVAAKIGQLLPTPPGDSTISKDTASEAARLTKASGAAQVVYATVDRVNGNRVKVQLYRVDASGTLLQMESALDLDTRLDGLVAKVAEMLVKKFQ